MTIPTYFVEKAQEIKNIGGTFYAVGGHVRDIVIGNTPKDIDFVICGITVNQAKEIFGSFEAIHPKAPVYGVWFEGEQYEVAFPRIEVSNGESKQDFEFIVTSDIKQDAVRRDFTMNAMYMDVITQEIFDPFNGQTDIDNKVIRHCSTQFAESPERIFRAIAFQSRFGFEIADETKAVIRQMVAHDAVAQIPTEQIWKQGYAKIFSGKFIQKAMTTMIDFGIAPKEVVDMVGCVQSTKHHPEGDVFTHSGMAAEYMAINWKAEFNVPKEIAVCISFAHDMGKPETTVVDGDKITAYGHEDSQVPYQFMAKIGFPIAYIDIAKSAIQNHMSRFEDCTKKAVGKFARKANGYIAFNFAVIKADCMARSFASEIPQNVYTAEKMATEMKQDNIFTCFVSGDEIMTIKGIKPSKMVGIIKEAVIEAQVEGRVTCKADAVEFVSKFA